jgi:phosphatidylglycerophosphate synthase
VPEVPSIDELRAVAQPASVLGRVNGEHWMGRRMRGVSVYASRAAIRAGISANTLTGLMIVVGLLSAAAFSAPGWWPLLGVVGIEVYLLLDCADGEVARWNRATSATGVYLDRLGHYVVEAAIPVGLGLRAAEWQINGWTVAGMSAAILVLISKSETDLVDMARLHSGMPKMPDTAREMKPSGLAAARRVVSLVPFHRIVHAVEVSMLAAVAVVIDQLTDSLDYTRALVVALVVAAGITAVFHLVSVLTSSRLTAE